MEEIRAPRKRFSPLSHSESFGREDDEAQLKGDHYSSVLGMMDYHRLHPTTTAYDPTSSYRRVSQASPNELQHHNPHYVFTSSSESHPWARSRSVSSLSDASSGSDVLETTKSAKSSPVCSDCSTGNYCYSRADSRGCLARAIEMDTVDRVEAWSPLLSGSAQELTEVFTWVDEDNDGLISGADLRGFLSRVLAFDISEDEAENLLLFYGNGRTLRTGGRAVVDFEGFLTVYQCLCGEQPSPEEQSMMVAASQVFDETRLKSDRWA